MLDRLGLPRRLREVGIEQSALVDVAEHTADDWFAATVPRPAGREDLLALLVEAW